MNRKGRMVLRDIMFVVLIFTAIFVLASVFVNEMGVTYSNNNMTSQYQGSGLYTQSNSSFSETTTSIDNMQEKASESLSGFTAVVTILSGAGTIISEVFKAPITFGNILEQMMVDASINQGLATTIGFIVPSFIYIVIIFSIITAFLKGGEM